MSQPPVATPAASLTALQQAKPQHNVDVEDKACNKSLWPCTSTTRMNEYKNFGRWVARNKDCSELCKAWATSSLCLMTTVSIALQFSDVDT